MSDKANPNSKKKGSFSTADFFKRDKGSDFVRKSKKNPDAKSSPRLEYVPPELKKIFGEMTMLIYNRRRRNRTDSWDRLFTRLRDADYWGSAEFSGRLHEALLQEFGYYESFEDGPLESDPEPMKNPPIHPRVIAYIFRRMNWYQDRTDRETAKQRRWLKKRSGHK